MCIDWNELSGCNFVSSLLCVHVHAFIHCRRTADHRLRGSDRTFLGNYPVKDKDTPNRIFTSAERQEVNTGEVVVVMVMMSESNFNNLKCLFPFRSVSMLGFVLLCLSQFVCVCARQRERI